ncbi:MAG TPA: hypothetical protein ENK28_00180 [Aliiroseovarius sp.]|nr:hypothetical protein [Aliiroseovarius sp.]
MKSRYARISADTVLQYMRDELDPMLTAYVEHAIETDSLAPEAKSIICGAIKQVSRGESRTYQPGAGCTL